MSNDGSTSKDFLSPAIFSKLQDIRKFSLVVDVPPIIDWSDEKFKRDAVDRIFEQLREVVKAAGFYYEDELRATYGKNQVSVEYADDRYDFEITCDRENISIERRGSRLSNFYDWYTALMPSAQGIMTHVASVLSETSGRKIDIIRALYRFHFLIYDICPEGSSKRVLNSEIMQKLLKGFPDDQGKLTPDDKVFGSIARADVSVNRWIGEEDKRRGVRFSVEAPANMGWSSLWFTFAYIGQSYTSPITEKRYDVRADTVLSEYEYVLNSFLRDTAINGFMAHLLAGYRFNSTPSSLP